MTDRYTSLVNSPLGKKVTRALGLPKPVPLKRYRPGDGYVQGTVIAIGHSAALEAVVNQLVADKVDIRRNFELPVRPQAVLIGIDGAKTIAEFNEVIFSAKTAVKALNKHGRVVLLGQDPVHCVGVKTRAIAAASQGFIRSLAHELRAGATANGVLLQNEQSTNFSAVIETIKFFLSARSAFVSGQFLAVNSETQVTVADSLKPLEGKTAVVTGAARGIGARISKVLARDGATVFGVDIPAAGDSLARVCNEIGAIAVQVDITATGAANKILDTIQQRGFDADIIVHNAGITRDKLFVNMNEDQWNSVLSVNLDAQLSFNEVYLEHPALGMKPRIISLASTSGIAGNRGQTNYAAAKAGVMGMVEATAATIGARGGTINAVAPGFIETDMTASMPFATREVARRLNSLQQGGQPEDVAEVIAFLASDSAGGINGETLRVCGQSLVGA